MVSVVSAAFEDPARAVDKRRDAMRRAKSIGKEANESV